MSEHEHERLRTYLARGERVVVATHRHWFAIAEPFLTASLGIIVILAFMVGGAGTGLIDVLLVAWLVLFGRAAVRLWEWNREWFVATDQRLILIYGFIIRKVDMLPMSKVTDMTYHRSIFGRMFGYGTFVLESAGQDQALSDLHFIPDPNDTYLKIVQTIFKTGDLEDGEDVPLSDDEYDEYDEYEDGMSDEVYEDAPDPTDRPALREEIARLGEDRSRRSRRPRHGARARDEDGDPDTLSFTMDAEVHDGPGPVHDQRAPRRGVTYSETLYSSLGSQQARAWDGRAPHEKKRRWFR